MQSGGLRDAPREDLVRTRIIALLRQRCAPTHLRHIMRHQVFVHLLSAPVTLPPAAGQADRRAAAVDHLLELDHAPGPERPARVVHLMADPVDVEEHHVGVDRHRHRCRSVRAALRGVIVRRRTGGSETHQTRPLFWEGVESGCLTVLFIPRYVRDRWIRARPSPRRRPWSSP